MPLNCLMPKGIVSLNRVHELRGNTYLLVLILFTVLSLSLEQSYTERDGSKCQALGQVRGFRSFPRVSKLIQNHKQFTIASKNQEKIPFFIFFNGQ